MADHRCLPVRWMDLHFFNSEKVFQFENGRFQTKGIVAGRTWLTGKDLFPPAPLNLPGAVPTPGSSQVTSFQGRWKRR